MAQFHVELYPVMLLSIGAVEAADTGQAIQQAVAIAEAQHLAASGDGSQGPVFTQEYARYIVTPIVDGQLDVRQSETFLDAAFVNADQRDRQAGFPLYDLSVSLRPESPSPPGD